MRITTWHPPETTTRGRPGEMRVIALDNGRVFLHSPERPLLLVSKREQAVLARLWSDVPDALDESVIAGCKSFGRWLALGQAAPAESAHEGRGAFYIEVTGHCNLACSHCIAADSEKTALDKSLLTSIFAQARQQGWTGVALGGGEPLLHPDVFDVAKSAMSHNLEVTVKTNGTIWSEPAKKIAALPVRWHISLDGWDEATHDRVRGPGSFRRTLENVARLKRSRSRLESCSVVLTPFTLGDEEKFIHLAEALGFEQVSFTFKIPTEPSAAPTWPSQRERGAALIRLYELAKSYAGRIAVAGEAFSGVLGALLRGGRHIAFGCSAGEFIKIDSGGNVFPCPYITSPQRAYGNLYRTPAGKIFDRCSAYSASKRFQEAGPSCRSCALFHFCGGGCLAWRDVRGEVTVGDGHCQSRRMLYEHALEDLTRIAEGNDGS
jgi:radical SAM protein with 4Fe4S-binding SPASM domain